METARGRISDAKQHQWGNATHYSIPAFPGDTLNNGAIIIEEIVHLEGGRDDFRSDTRKSIVLAIYPGAVEPFVTWTRWVTIQDSATGAAIVTDDCAAGHYNRKIEDAVKDFKSRVKVTISAQHAIANNPRTRR